MKVFSLFLICTLFFFSANAQSLFSHIPTKSKTVKKVNNITGAVVDVTIDEPTFWAFRPAFIAATLFIGGTVEAAAGGGIAYQNITQKGPDGKNYVNYDAGIYVLAGGSIVKPKENNSDIEKFAFVITALNGTIGGGYGMSRQEIDPVTLKRKWRGGFALVWKYNLNNGFF